MYQCMHINVCNVSYLTRISMTELQVRTIKMMMMVSRIKIMKTLIMIVTIPVKLRHLMPKVFMAGRKLTLF